MVLDFRDKSLFSICIRTSIIIAVCLARVAYNTIIIGTTTSNLSTTLIL